MYTEIKDYLTYELYPALYDRLDEEGVLEEFKFKKHGDRYVSTTAAKHTGREGKTKGQVIVYKNNPSALMDHSEAPAGQDILNYVQTIQSGEDIGFYEAITKLTAAAKIKPYGRQLTEEEKEEYRKHQRTAKLWEAAVNYCIQCINDVQYKEEAKPVIDYLINKRKYTGQDVAAMQLGYLPSTAGLFEYLNKQGYSKEEIKNTITLPTMAGVSHKLIIPIRNAAGKAVGLAMRNVNFAEGQGYKYLYTTGLKKTEALFNLYSKAINKTVILVEGQLDAAIPQARGYNEASIAAIGGKSISSQQVDHLIKAGTEAVYICLDNEEGTTANIKKTIDALTEVDQLGDSIYIVQLPKGIKDVDQLITVEGIEAFKKVIASAQAYYSYLTDQRTAEYNKEKAAAGVDHSDKILNDLIDDVVRIAATIKNPVRRDDLKGLFSKALQAEGIQATEEAFKAAVDRIRYKDDQAKQNEELKAELKKAEDKRKAGDVTGAITQLGDRLRSIKLRDKFTEFQQLDSVKNEEEDIKKRIQESPEAVDIGYRVKVEGQEEEIQLAAGQLTFIAAATGHGKTTFLINTGLNIIKQYPDKEVYFFTFEVSDDSIKLQALNTYIGEDLNQGSNNNRKTILQYFKGVDKWIAGSKKKMFEEKKTAFFTNILPRLKIRYTNYSADELIEYIEYIKKQTDKAVILIDYVQKLRSDRKGSITNRPTELKFVCEDLNDAAIRSGFPIALGAQFNREVLTPLDMAAVRMAEGSDIEKTASEILGLWNCTKKLERKIDKNEHTLITEKYKINTDNLHPEGAIILEVLKSRSMATGHTAKLSYNGNTGVIGNEEKKKNYPTFEE